MPRCNRIRRSAVALVICAMLTSIALAEPGILTTGADEVLNLGLRGVHFVPNEGQWSDADVWYGLRSRGLDVAFRESSFTMHLRREIGQSVEPAIKLQPGATEPSTEFEALTLGVSFPGSNIVIPEGVSPQVARFNYFVGGEESGVASDVPSFGAVVYHNLYDGVHLHVMGSHDGVLKYEFHVQPGADYGQIRIAYDGIESLCVDDSGDLRVVTTLGTLTDRAPLVWQEDPSSHETIAARFELCDDHTYRIALDGLVDRNRELIIDPDLQWMTYLGGSEAEQGQAFAIDASGNALVTGYTNSSDFEGNGNAYHGGNMDAYLAQVDPDGRLQWMTYLGGSGDDEGRGIAIDASGNALVAGFTDSADFEGRNNDLHGNDDAFVAHVNSSGQLQWMTYLGGTDFDQASNGIVLDASGNALLTGYSKSTDFEGRTNENRGNADAFIAEVNSGGHLQWMTYFGGSSYDGGLGITIDSAGNLLVTGDTYSADFEERNNSFHEGHDDAFVAQLDSNGHVQWMTYLGGSLWDAGFSIAVDASDNALVSGKTNSSDIEGRSNEWHFYYDAFVAKVDSSGQLQWLYYLGGSSNDYGTGIAIDAAENILVTGSTSSTDFEGRSNRYHGGNLDAFVAQLDSNGQLRRVFYLGGTAFDGGSDIAVDASGNLLVTGPTYSSDFEGRNNAFHGGGYDAFVVKLRIPDAPQLSVSATCPTGGPIQVSWSGATGGGTVALLYARNTGTFRIPNGNRCAGTLLGLGRNQIQIAYQGSGGQSGSRTVNSNAGPGVCGGYLQLIDVPACGTSNVARIE